MGGATGLSQALGAMPWELAGRIALAALLGGIIGGEREYSGQSAGLRTNILVSVGACLFTILSIYGFAPGPESGQVGRDPARIAAQIVSGIGFLGAGAVFRDGDHVRGMTTAATIWLVAAIGMAAGTGSYFLGVVGTVITVLVLAALRPVRERLSRYGAERDSQE
ncbi:MAG: hypothetical protein OHK0015_27330 [Chloroflexi bacterium OHK40]